jgi:hypothetical protein
MTFTFNNSLGDNVSLVRFHIGDTSDKGHYLEDETIRYFINTGSVGSAVIACIKYIITQLSSPNFRLDWLTVSNEQARAGYETLLKMKQQEFGISSATVSCTIKHAHRADSYEYSDTVNYDGLHYDDPSGGAP